jgi:hypothetical protein
MRLDNNFKFKYDPFGLVDFSYKNIPYVESIPTPKSKSSFAWILWGLVILVLGAIIYLCFKTYDSIVTKDDKISTNNEMLKIDEAEALFKNGDDVAWKLLPEHKVIARYDLGKEDSWNLELLELKKSQSKAQFVKGHGWLLYE